MKYISPLEELFLAYKKTGALHHAYFIESVEGIEDSSTVIELIDTHLMPTRGNPDFWHGTHDSFGIDEGRMLKEMQQKMPARGNKKIFVISAGVITREAQNSLLKMFEDPTAGSHFFLVMPSVETLLLTLRSRLMIVSPSGSLGRAEKNDLSGAKSFLALSRSARIKFLAPLIEEGDRRKALAFLDLLERAIASALAGGPVKKLLKEKQTFLAELYAMKSYLHDRSSSVKMILEHIALIV